MKRESNIYVGLLFLANEIAGRSRDASVHYLCSPEASQVQALIIPATARILARKFEPARLG